ncbi:MAG: hypothetical protein ACJ8FY_21560 [Gemmataceae bacterium]
MHYFIGMDSQNGKTWKYLGPKPGSSYKQLFINGRGIAARTLYGAYMSEEFPRTPQQIAQDWDVPLEAVMEAIAYCQTDPPEIREDWEEEEAFERSRILNDPRYYFPGIDKVRANLLAEQEAKKSSPPC